MSKITNKQRKMLKGYWLGYISLANQGVFADYYMDAAMALYELFFAKCREFGILPENAAKMAKQWEAESSQEESVQ